MKKLSAKRLEILEYLSAFTRENGYPPSIREICQAVNLSSPSTVHAHIRILKEDGYLEKNDHKTRAISLKNDTNANFRAVPILGTVTAGVPILAQQEVCGFVPYDGSCDVELFALNVRGESMLYAGILDGDVVIVRQQSSANNGQIVVALIEDEATVKRISLQNDEVWLMPENPAFEPIDGSGCTILGIVISLYRPSV